MTRALPGDPSLPDSRRRDVLSPAEIVHRKCTRITARGNEKLHRGEGVGNDTRGRGVREEEGFVWGMGGVAYAPWLHTIACYAFNEDIYESVCAVKIIPFVCECCYTEFDESVSRSRMTHFLNYVTSFPIDCVCILNPLRGAVFSKLG